jgi:ABC-type antimicrobial peptide transport system permease subunit
MGIGVSIFLIALGAILTFATDVSVSGLDLDVVGIVLMVAGALGLIMTLVIWGPRRRAAAVDRVDRVERAAPPRDVVQERRVYRDEPPL